MEIRAQTLLLSLALALAPGGVLSAQQGPPAPSCGEPGHEPFNACGTIVEGVTCPVLFETDGGEKYLVSLVGWSLGDRVEVTACRPPVCLDTCHEIDGCLTDAVVTACAEPEPCPEPGHEPIRACGTVIPGVECPFFQADSGEIYFVGFPAAQIGDRIEVSGCLLPVCLNICLQSFDGCIGDATVTPCADEVLCQADLGSGGPGTARLSVCGGDLSTGSDAVLRVEGAPAGALAFGFAGMPLAPVPVAGGTLVPNPWVILRVDMTDVFGGLTHPIRGGGGPLTLVSQYVVVDDGQPQGFAFTNAVQVTFLP